MTITNFQVQNIIKAYRVQSAVRSRMGKEKNVKNVPQRDEVNFSPESKKRLLAERITEGLKQQLFRGEERSETIQRALDQLSQEYGKNLDFDIENEGSLTFTVTDPKSPGEIQMLPVEENQKLQARLFDITRNIIYDNLI
jgi:hypothetical protein